MLFDFYFAKFNFLCFISTPSNRSPICIWFYLRYKNKKNYTKFSVVLSGCFEGCEFPLSFSFSIFLLLLDRNLLSRYSEERAIRDTIFLGMNSTQARDKAINLMNEEGKELTVEFLMQQLDIEDCNAHHKSLFQLDSSTSINFAAYDHRQNKAKSNKKN